MNTRTRNSNNHNSISLNSNSNMNMNMNTITYNNENSRNCNNNYYNNVDIDVISDIGQHGTNILRGEDYNHSRTYYHQLNSYQNNDIDIRNDLISNEMESSSSFNALYHSRKNLFFNIHDFAGQFFGYPAPAPARLDIPAQYAVTELTTLRTRTSEFSIPHTEHLIQPLGGLISYPHTNNCNYIDRNNCRAEQKADQII